MMRTHLGLCPACGMPGEWEFGRPGFSLPPTGGDYEWVETDAMTRCPACQAAITARIQIDIDTGTVTRLVSSPMPEVNGWRCFVVAHVRQYAADLVAVSAMHFAASATEAREWLQQHGGAFELNWERRAVLELTASGYHELNGVALHPSANRMIEYA